MTDRTTFVGSSDVAPILGLSPYLSPVDIWRQKVGELDGSADTPATRRGRFLEPALLAHYGLQRIAKLRIDLVLHDEWRRAQLDAINTDESRVVEAKTVSRHAYRHGDWGEPGTDQIPEHYLCQVQWQLDLAALETAHVVVAVLPEDPDEVLGLDAAGVLERCDVHLYEVQRHGGIIMQIRERTSHFWTVNVGKRIPPDPMTYAEAEALWWRARHKGAEVVADAAALQHVRLLEFARRLQKRAHEVEERAKLSIAEFMQDREVLTDGHSPLLEWVVQNRAGYAVQPTTYKTMRLTKWWKRTNDPQIADDAAKAAISGALQPQLTQETKP